MSETEDLREAAWLEFTRNTPEAFWDVEVWRHEGWLSGGLDVASRKRIVLALLALPQVAELREVNDDVCVMWLCEAERVMLRTDLVYRFEAKDGCERCEELASTYRAALASDPTTHESEA